MGQSASFNKKHQSSSKEGYDYTSDAIRRAPGLGAYGISPRNPIIEVQRGHGPRGGGENRSVNQNRSQDPRGETPAILNRIRRGETRGREELTNDRLDAEQEDQRSDLSLRYSRRITS